MDNMTATELVETYNFLVAETRHAMKRVNLILKAATPPESREIFWNTSPTHRAEMARYTVESIMKGEHPTTIEQTYRLYREANKAWGRCLTVRKKAIAALRREILAYAECGMFEKSTALAVMLSHLAAIKTADWRVHMVEEVTVKYDQITSVSYAEESSNWRKKYIRQKNQEDSNWGESVPDSVIVGDDDLPF